MAAKPRHKKSPSSLQHPIRVVPLHRPEAERVAAAVAPRLSYRGGPLLTSVEVFTIFWGPEWNQSPQSVVMKNMNLFFDYILASALMDQLGEYSVPGKNIGHGKRTGTIVLTSPAPGACVQDSEIQQLLQQEIASKNLPAPNRNSLYFVFLPPRISAAITTAPATTFSMRSCRTPVVRGAPAASPSPTRSLPPARTSFAKQSRIQCPARDGTTTATARLETFARGKRASSAATRFNWNGRTMRGRACELRIVFIVRGVARRDFSRGRK